MWLISSALRWSSARSARKRSYRPRPGGAATSLSLLSPRARRSACSKATRVRERARVGCSRPSSVIAAQQQHAHHEGALGGADRGAGQPVRQAEPRRVDAAPHQAPEQADGDRRGQPHHAAGEDLRAEGAEAGEGVLEQPGRRGRGAEAHRDAGAGQRRHGEGLPHHADREAAHEGDREHAEGEGVDGAHGRRVYPALPPGAVSSRAPREAACGTRPRAAAPRTGSPGRGGSPARAGNAAAPPSRRLPPPRGARARGPSPAPPP